MTTHPVGLGVPGVLDEPVGAPGARGELVHGLLHDARRRRA